MASFAEFIATEFHSAVTLLWNTHSPQFVYATFAVSSISVEVSFAQREANGPWYVSFDVRQGESTESAYLAFHIFNGVFQAAREFVEIREPAILIFATKRDELASVYQTYLRREQPAMTKLGYELGPPQTVEPYTEFVLRRAARVGTPFAFITSTNPRAVCSALWGGPPGPRAPVLGRSVHAGTKWRRDPPYAVLQSAICAQRSSIKTKRK